MFRIWPALISWSIFRTVHRVFGRKWKLSRLKSSSPKGPKSAKRGILWKILLLLMNVKRTGAPGRESSQCKKKKKDSCCKKLNTICSSFPSCFDECARTAELPTWNQVSVIGAWVSLGIFTGDPVWFTFHEWSIYQSTWIGYLPWNRKCQQIRLIFSTSVPKSLDIKKYAAYTMSEIS